MRIRFAALVLVSVLAGCDSAPVELSSMRSFSAIGAYNVAQWVDPSVPGSDAQRTDGTLPAYFVCPVEGDPTARASAILSSARIQLRGDGTAELALVVGEWARVGGAQSSRGETITRWGRWSESQPGTVILAGFGVPGLGDTLSYTELGHAELRLRLPCPNVSALLSVQPTISLDLDR